MAWCRSIRNLVALSRRFSLVTSEFASSILPCYTGAYLDLSRYGRIRIYLTSCEVMIDRESVYGSGRYRSRDEDFEGFRSCRLLVFSSQETELRLTREVFWIPRMRNYLNGWLAEQSKWRIRQISPDWMESWKKRMNEGAVRDRGVAKLLEIVIGIGNW
jgi:hypothetical protein